MKQMLIVPDRQDMDGCLALTKKYGVGFEYNDFYLSDVLDDKEKMQQIAEAYNAVDLPKYCTTHGAFFDVLPVSADQKVREISDLRIRQSIAAAKNIGARAIVFHPNYNPFLNSESYIKGWVEANAAYWGSVLEQNPDLNIYLENMFDRTPEVLEQLSEKLCKYENFGICLDVGHAFLSKTPLTVWAKHLGRFVKHVHINDNDGISDLHLAWGDGIIPKETFYHCYNEFMSGASVLVETSGYENKEKSLQRLKEDGFLD